MGWVREGRQRESAAHYDDTCPVCCRLRRLVRDAGTELRVGTAIAGGIHERERRQSGLHSERKSGTYRRLAGSRRWQYNEYPWNQTRPWQRDDPLSWLRGRGLPTGRPLGYL